MTKQEKQLWLEAIGKLRGYYKQYHPVEIPDNYELMTDKQCPLCVVAKGLGGKTRLYVCDFCLWVKFEGEGCRSSFFYLDTTQERLKRLYRWENKLKEIK